MNEERKRKYSENFIELQDDIKIGWLAFKYAFLKPEKNNFNPNECNYA